MANCILPEYIEEIKKIVENTSTSALRLSRLTELFNNQKAAQEINSMIDRKFLLKNQENVINKIIDNVSGVEATKKAKLKEQIALRLKDRTTKIYEDDLVSISKDIFDSKYKTEITTQQTQVINKLNSELNKFPEYSKEWAEKKTELSEFIDLVINPEQNLGFIDTIKNILKKTGQRYEGLSSVGKVIETGRVGIDLATSAVYKSIQASMDASFALRQGFKVLAQNPKQWVSNLVEAFKPFSKILTKQQKWEVMHNFKVKLLQNPLYKQAIDSKLAIGVIEEFFPTTLAERIPVLGNLFKASNEAFTIFSQGSRMDLFEGMVKHAKDSGTKLTPELYKDLAMLSNSITGRGNMGELEKISGVVNKLLYSGRFIKSQIDTFYLPFKKDLTPLAREIAIKSSLKTLGAMATLMTFASLFTEVETDPRSSKFGKMKVLGSKDTWVDISGNLGSYITLASRIATLKSKSATTGKITKLNDDKFGAKTALDVVYDFLGNKLAPAPSSIKSVLKGKNFQGDKPTVGNTVSNLVTPISVANMTELFQDEDLGPAFLGTMFDLLGSGQIDYTQFR